MFIIYLAKFYFSINDIFSILPGNEQEPGHENIGNTYLFHQVCKIHDIFCFGDKSADTEKAQHLGFRHSCSKLVSWMITALDTMTGLSLL